MLILLLSYLVPLLLLYSALVNYGCLKHIPGPFLAKFTDLYRLYQVYTRKPHETQVSLHKRYGDLVRLGPHCISVSGPDYASQIYGIGRGLIKSNFYAVFQNIVNGRRAASLVAMTNESDHAKSKRQIAHAYSLSTLVEFEPLVDSTTEILLAHLDSHFAQRGESCDLGRWLQYYAFDVIGELTFSKRLGFIDTGEDVGSIIHSIGKNFEYFSVIGQMPWLDDCLGKNPLYIKYFAKPVSSPILKFAQQLLSERLDAKDEEKKADRPDFLSRFLQVRQESPEPMSDRQVLSLLFMNINAGSDTIASTVRATFYHLLKTPSTLGTLMTELESASSKGRLTLPCPTWTETQSSELPYLRAVIKESLRMNPALSLPLERIVPAGGLSVQHPDDAKSSTFIPADTIIGINPYVLHRDLRIFGEDAESWNPSRWLESSGNSAEKIKNMDHSLLSFGAGKRSCLGKNIAMLELHKLVPAVLMRFKVELEQPEKEWDVRNAWVLNQTGLVVRLTTR